LKNILILFFYIVIISTMSYFINQKIGKYIYVYEVESYWDPLKKQPRQKRRYVGKKDAATGEVITPRKGFVPRSAQDFGHIYLLRHIAQRIGLIEVIQKSFPELTRELLALSMYQVLEAKPLYLCKPWAEVTYLKDPIELSSQRISRIVEELGKVQEVREKFFAEWTHMQKGIRAIIFDITSLSSYSTLLEYLEWGYNRDGEKLPQVNLGLIVGEPRGLPLAYRVYPGSIADVSTLKNIIVLLEYLGVKEFTFILDRGFYSAANIQEMGREKIQFVMPLSFSTALASRLISKHRAALQSPLQGFYYKGRPMFHVKEEVQINDTAVHAHVFHDERRKADEMEHLMRRIVDIEALVQGKEFRRAEDVQAYMEQVFPRSVHLFDLTREEEGFRLIRKAKAISRLMNRMRKTILITNNPALEREELLNLYRRKDVLEKMFETIKNELEGGRLKISSREAMEGRLFLTYLSLILYSELSRVMKEKDLYRSYTVSEVLFELKKLRAVTLNNGKVYLTELSKKQRMLFENFEVPIPVRT